MLKNGYNILDCNYFLNPMRTISMNTIYLRFSFVRIAIIYRYTHFLGENKYFYYAILGLVALGLLNLLSLPTAMAADFNNLLLESIPSSKYQIKYLYINRVNRFTGNKNGGCVKIESQQTI